jgi:hypothetical protein
VAALVILAVVVAALFASRGRQVAPTTGAVRPTVRPLANGAPLCDGDGRTQLNLSPTQSVESVAMVSPSEGWAVGVDYGTGGSLIVHGVSCVWTPIANTFAGVGLMSVSMSLPDEGWALGVHGGWFVGGQGAGTGGVLLHYKHGAWQQDKLDVGLVSDHSKIQMIAPDEGWMYVNGGISPGPTSKQYQNTVWHYLSGTWSKVAMPFVKPTTQIWGLSAISSGDCWVVGYDSLGVIGHYHSGVWASIRTPQTYYDVAMISSTQGWAVGNMTLMQYDGTGWHDASGQISHPNGSPELDSVMATSPTEVWGFNEPFESGDYQGTFTGQQEQVMHLKDGIWTWESIPLGPIDFVRQLSMASTTEGWAVGIMHDSSNQNSFSRGVLVRYHQGAWTSYEPSVANPNDGQGGPIG